MEKDININDIILEHARDILQILWSEMYNELNKLGREGHFTLSLLVSKVRDYNRKWNIKAEDDTLLIVDGFQKYAKKHLIEKSNLGPDFITALRYL